MQIKIFTLIVGFVGRLACLTPPNASHRCSVDNLRAEFDKQNSLQQAGKAARSISIASLEMATPNLDIRNSE
jgi:hypothetical protein